MCRIGVEVPPGFTLTTPLCQVFQQSNDLPAEMWEMVKAAVKTVETDTGKKYGSDENPLLFSCRSGAAISMPGMMVSAFGGVILSCPILSSQRNYLTLSISRTPCSIL
jgi:phosphoenolpyruvate synthase/pyruvate phosphate dikinase